MMDRDKIIKGLELCARGSMCVGSDCPYWHNVIDDVIKACDCSTELVRDALTLLREDCHNCKLECLLQKYDELKEKYDALLKEKEAVEPVTESSVYDPDTWFFVCGSCKKGVIDRGDKFCRWCGRKVKWE
jgi:hypothetical protein